MTWFTATSVSVSNGATIVSVNTGDDISIAQEAGGLIIGSNPPVEIKRTYLDGSGNKKIELRKAWSYASQTNQAAVAFPTDGDLAAATAVLKGLIDGLTVATKVEAETATDNTKIMTPLRTKESITYQVGQSVTPSISNSLGFARSGYTQATFEAIRAQNNEEFAASGFVHFGKHSSAVGETNVNQGMNIQTVVSNTLRLGRPTDQSPAGSSKTTYPVLNIAGVITDIKALNYEYGYTHAYVKFPAAPDGKTTYNKSNGVNTTYTTAADAFSAASADPTNVEVVTDRVDMWGFEAWLEEVSTTNPYVYPNGLIQSQATIMDGVTTSSSSRPVTYYAVFAGDTGSKGKGVNFNTLTDAQKKKVLANPKNNLYYLNDGRLVQWRLRQRTIAGAGNGDWSLITPYGSAALGFTTSSRVLVQGKVNSIGGDFTGSASSSFNGDLNITQYERDYQLTGLFGNSYYTSAFDGDCAYFLVCGTVSRLNQGAYHPSYNPLGTGMVVNTSETSWVNWYSSVAKPFTSVSALFTPFSSGGVSGAPSIGSLSQSSQAGRPDSRFYDVIYASGQGGVCRDMRYSAHGVTPTKFSQADLEVKNGTYRGFEKRVFSSFYEGSSGGNTSVGGWGISFTSGASGGILYLNSAPSDWQTKFEVGDILGITDGSKTLALELTVKQTVTIYTFSVVSNTGFPTKTPSNSTGLKLLKADKLSQSVGGSFLQVDVIGDPANILITDALKNGWEGSWIPVIPNGTSKELPFTRKIYTGTPKGVYTQNNGSSWITHTGFTYDLVKNSVTATFGAGLVFTYEYQAFAKQTEPAANEVVYGGAEGVGDVYASSFNQIAFNRGVLTAESLLNIILKNSTGVVNGQAKLTHAIINEGKFSTATGYLPKHNALTIDLPNNNSQAFKVLDYNVNLNQQAFKQYAATELKSNGTNWGDDSKITIVDRESTKTDLNGETVKVVTHKLKEPIGWIKNKV